MNWKQEALQRQLSFKRNVLKLIESGTHAGKTYEHILSDKDALNGANFYCHNDKESWVQMQTWMNLQSPKKVNFATAGLKNMLRSEHIAIALACPMYLAQQTSQSELVAFLESILQTKGIDAVTDVKVEFASQAHKSKLQNDNTSFDVFLGYTRNGVNGGVGIEVKYTEKSYPYGKTEFARMFDERSEYNLLSNRCGYYTDKALPHLRTKKLKQLWRNHLLGIKATENGEYDEFYSVHLYPEGNTYQEIAATEYQILLQDEFSNTFIPITFEKWIQQGTQFFTDTKWLDYMKNRY